MSSSPARLYTHQDLGKGKSFALTDAQEHYLFHVLRKKPDDIIKIFNGRDGEFLARIADKHSVEVTDQLRAQQAEADIWLVFAPLKKDATDFVITKATELGASELWPVFTERTNTKRLNAERAEANAVEAAEQTERLSVPHVHDAVSLRDLLLSWPSNRTLIFCDEGRDAPPIHDYFMNARKDQSFAILIGPEGGFSDSERADLRRLPFVQPVNLGPRILRADTAAVAALACFQAVLGDWKNG